MFAAEDNHEINTLQEQHTLAFKKFKILFTQISHLAYYISSRKFLIHLLLFGKCDGEFLSDLLDLDLQNRLKN